MELYRYLLQFGPEHAEQHELRTRLCTGHCPCCLRICLRWVARRFWGGPACIAWAVEALPWR